MPATMCRSPNMRGRTRKKLPTKPEERRRRTAENRCIFAFYVVAITRATRTSVREFTRRQRAELQYDALNTISILAFHKFHRTDARKVARQNQRRERQNTRFAAHILRMIASSKSRGTSRGTWKLLKYFDFRFAGDSEFGRGCKSKK